VAGHALTAADARSQLQADLTPLNNGPSTYSTQIQACHTDQCVGVINREVAGSFNTFAGQVRDIAMPSGPVSANAASLAASASHVAGIYTALAGATSTSQYESIAAGLQPALAQMNSDYSTLINDLGGS
jgi:hypothetical protein